MRIHPGAAEALVRHDWPGNVRELQNAVLRATALTSTGEILAEHLSPRILGKSPRKSGGIDWEGVAPLASRVDALERRTSMAALEAAGGQKAGAARMLGISRQGLDAKMTRLDIPYLRGKAVARPSTSRSH